jgi:hypothetical protein
VPQGRLQASANSELLFTGFQAVRHSTEWYCACSAYNHAGSVTLGGVIDHGYCRDTTSLAHATEAQWPDWRALRSAFALSGESQGMDPDRKTVFELAAAVVIIVAFTAGAYLVSSTYAASANGANASAPPAVAPGGGFALVGTIAAFIFVVAVIGLFMYRQDFDDE